MPLEMYNIVHKINFRWHKTKHFQVKFQFIILIEIRSIIVTKLYCFGFIFNVLH